MVLESSLDSRRDFGDSHSPSDIAQVRSKSAGSENLIAVVEGHVTQPDIGYHRSHQLGVTRHTTKAGVYVLTPELPPR